MRNTITKTYKNSSGEQVTLDTLCRQEPEWAASRIRYLEQQIEEMREAEKK
jgi:hypothetical protein